MTPEQIATRGMIIRSLVGSSIHELELAGTDDRHEMSVCIEPPEYVIGLRFTRGVGQALAPRGNL
jgi:hypothetical protein